jgi:hypothetical protein
VLQPVYDSKSMTPGELERLIARHEGARLPCLRLHLRPDGTIVTKDCFAPIVRAGRWLWLRACLAAMTFWTVVAALHPFAKRIDQAAAKMRSMSPLEDERETIVGQGLGVVRRRVRPDPELEDVIAGMPAPLPDPDKAPPLRVLEVEEDSPLSSLMPR